MCQIEQMLGLDNQDFAFFPDLENKKSKVERNLVHYFVISDLINGDLLSVIWLFTLKGFLMLRCSYNW